MKYKEILAKGLTKTSKDVIILKVAEK